MNEGLQQKVSLLIQMARVDGDFDIKEKAFIYNVCLRHGLSLEAIGDLIDNYQPVLQFKNMSRTMQLDFLTDIISMMQVDGKVLPLEVGFCLDMAERLGFERAAVEKLIEEIKSQYHISYEELYGLVATLPYK